MTALLNGAHSHCHISLGILTLGIFGAPNLSVSSTIGVTVSIFSPAAISSSRVTRGGVEEAFPSISVSRNDFCFGSTKSAWASSIEGDDGFGIGWEFPGGGGGGEAVTHPLWVGAQSLVRLIRVPFFPARDF
ncbi:hypothetical protein SLE2022_029200 [Rubroshorea leprosula]